MHTYIISSKKFNKRNKKGSIMPDISMCEDHDCPKRLSCYRYCATPSPYYQSYFAKSPRKKNKCDYHMPLKNMPAQSSYDEML